MTQHNEGAPSGAPIVLSAHRLARAAFHEAGHACAALHVGSFVRRVSTVPDPAIQDGNRGVTQFFNPVAWHKELDRDVPRQAIENLMFIFYAGMAAETRFLGGRSCCSRAVAADDLYNARCVMHIEMSDEVCTPTGEAAVQSRFEWRARRFVGRARVWRAICAVARALMRRRTLSGAKVRSLVPSDVQNTEAIEQWELAYFRSRGWLWFRNADARKMMEEFTREEATRKEASSDGT